jgi:hypothetical protein
VILLSRLIAALAYAGAAFLLGLALGERGELGVIQRIFAVVIPVSTIVMLVYAKGTRLHVTLTGLAMLAGLLIGQRQWDRAWEDCLARGSSVRSALMAYEREHGGYPARLEDLPIELPCRAGFRRTILHYLSNERGFRLWITNNRESVNLSSRR